MPGISVLTTALSTGQQEGTVTDDAGNFLIDGVMPDNVLIQQQALPAGFAPSTSNGGFEYRTLFDGQAAVVMFGNSNSGGGN